MQPSIELFDPPDNCVDVDLAGQAILVVPFLYRLLYLLLLKLALDIVPHPPQPVLLEILLHLLDLLPQSFVILF